MWFQWTVVVNDRPVPITFVWQGDSAAEVLDMVATECRMAYDDDDRVFVTVMPLQRGASDDAW